ncbi:XAP5-domain-containing protein [Microstroma glucosiphilum]|uniref:XAP5-domain-containing protein n=1 Tax=Pseudomicrostroma glucosiphilum TaxID=1684307 RepID=A0A316UI14_9BASI|nr:XAP5-domain-containing protein [Pseudomicrostroma glucosiphilum]PWN22835.1 XAP5-domain-containing protein [Pseudomicrostroma glucosiphilum]
MSTSAEEQRRHGKHEKARAMMMEEFDRQKADMAKEAERAQKKAGDRFVGNTDSIEETLKKNTVGLVSAEDFKKRREELEELKRREAAKTSELKAEEKKKKKEKKTVKPKLSFAMDDEEEDGDAMSPFPTKRKAAPSTSSNGNGIAEGEPVAAKKRLLKNPGVDTSFLPDRARDEEERKIRETLRQEWLKKQEDIKGEAIEITYSYWDGTGHRKTVKCKKGDSIADFLEKCRQQFPELRNQSVDNLMYIKEDLIVPHHHTFYEFIINKARGKSGPLFNFDVHEDVRMVADATVEKDESHAGKVVERNWYNRNKHIFPASRWELYEVGKDYGNYSIHDRSKGK